MRPPIRQIAAHGRPKNAYDPLIRQDGRETTVDRSEIITDESVEFIRQGDGRWRWHARTPAAAQLLGTALDAPSMLSFKTAIEAAADVAVHADARRDDTGRHVMTREYIRRMISAIALPCAACADVYFGGVYWHQRDASGANWGVAIMNGTGDFDGCLGCVASAREELRRLYAIVDEA
jgi:tryptophan 2,3-dioxygenase